MQHEVCAQMVVYPSVRSELVHNRRHDLELFIERSFESLFLEAIIAEQKTIIGVIYRPPGSCVSNFKSSLEKVLNSLPRSNVYLMGDFNVDLLKDSRPVLEISNSWTSFNYIPLITIPTRITSHSSTCIDNIFTNTLDVTISGVTLNEASDHFPIFCLGKEKIRCDKQFTYASASRKWTQVAQDAFNKEISQKHFSCHGNPNRTYSEFISCFSELQDKHFPKKRAKVHVNDSKPWLNNLEYKTMCKEKHHLFRLKVANPHDDELKSAYKAKLKEVNKHRDVLKRDYFHQRFTEASGNIGKTWKIINGIFSKARGPSYPNEFLDSSSLVSDPHSISDGFCKFFTEVANEFKKPGSTSVGFSKFIKKNQKSLFLHPCSKEEIISHARSITQKSSGPDEAMPKVIVGSVPLLAQHISDMVNECFLTGIFPDQLKEARITPVYKKGNNKLYSNYRPISILNIFSKIYERAMNQRLLSFLEAQQILSKNQFGFRKGRSPWLAINHLLEKVYSAWDKGEECLSLFIDVSKAFDAIDHRILLAKLEIIGLRGRVHELFKSYLSERKHQVSYKDHKSEWRKITSGVPQGSILGPVLFIIYINDLAAIHPSLSSTLFADDTTFTLSAKNSEELQQSVNCIMPLIDEWFEENNLRLNADKSVFTQFRQ